MLYLPFDMKRYHVTKPPFMPFIKLHFSFYCPKKLNSGRKFSKYKSFSLLPFYFITTGKMIAWRSKSSPFVLEIKFKSIWSYSHCTVADGTSRQSGSTVQIQNGLEARSVPLWWGAWARDQENKAQNLGKCWCYKQQCPTIRQNAMGWHFLVYVMSLYSVKSISEVFWCQPTQPAFAYASSFLNIMF